MVPMAFRILFHKFGNTIWIPSKFTKIIFATQNKVNKQFTSKPYTITIILKSLIQPIHLSLLSICHHDHSSAQIFYKGYWKSLRTLERTLERL